MPITIFQFTYKSALNAKERRKNLISQTVNECGRSNIKDLNKINAGCENETRVAHTEIKLKLINARKSIIMLRNT